MNLRLAIVVFSFSFIVVIYVGLIRKGQEDMDSKTMLPFQIKPMTIDRLKGLKFETEKEESKPAPAQSAPHVMSLDEFKRENPSYKIEQALDGRVISMRASGGDVFRSHRPVAPFHPKNREQVLAQAEAILNELSGVLGLNSQMPLSLPQISSTDLSAQIAYSQTLENVPLAPAVSVSMVLNGQGGVEALHSSYLPKAVVVNQRKHAGEGRPVLWVQSFEPVAQLRHAYETREKGIQKIVDADDQKVLLSRDKKIN